MNGFRITIGRQGSGKTILITKLCTDNYDGTRKVFSNYTLNKIPFTRIVFDTPSEEQRQKGVIGILEELEKDPKFFNNSIILLDEIHVYLDSFDVMKTKHRAVQIFFSQLRKRNILMFGTTQYIMNVDIRVRRQCMNVFEMEHIYKDLFKVNTLEIDGYFTRELTSYNVVLKDYYDSYDTNELILE